MLAGAQINELRSLLQDAVIKCHERCLYQSAKWAAELLTSVGDADPSSPADTEVDSPMEETSGPTVASGVVSANTSVQESKLEAQELHNYLLAKTYFDCREYDRCAAVFLPMTLPRGEMQKPDTKPLSEEEKAARANIRRTAGLEPTNGHASLFEKKNGTATKLPRLSQKALFLALYAKYMAGEKRRDEDSEMILGPADGAVTVNKELPFISNVLEERLLAPDYEGTGQGWLEYLFGIVLAKMKSTDAARQWLLKSLKLYEYNWGAWQELGALISSSDELYSITGQLPRGIMSYIFFIFEKQELFSTEDSLLQEIDSILSIFPTSSFLQTQKALIHYHAKDFEIADGLFSSILHEHPLRLDSLDAYSNILYVMELKPKLAFLAQLSTLIDRFRPETCCVVGNYYAMKSEHEKAVTYFRRALTLDRNFLSAWTLMGHEYVELKNTQAAIECYRRAVDINRKDYRAWYGLGQTYEVLEMHFYALFYYERAAQLYPYDPKMWAAVGSCLHKMQRPSEAVKAYKRALAAGSVSDIRTGSSFGARSASSRGRDNALQGGMDPDVLFALATCHDDLKQTNEVRAYLELVLAQEEEETEEPVSDSDDNEDRENNAETPGAGTSQTHGQSVRGGTSVAKSPPHAASHIAQLLSGHDTSIPQRPTRKRVGLGIGVTPTTSRARMWLVKLEMDRGTVAALKRANALAVELVQDGWEVEEARALARDCRARVEVLEAEMDT